MKKNSFGKSKKNYNFKSDNTFVYILLGVFLLSSIAYVFMTQSYNISFESFENAKTTRIEYYYKKECPHCVDFKPTWDKVSNDAELLKLVEFKSYDIKDDGGKSAKYGINSIPEVIAVNISNNDKKALFESNTRSIEDLTKFVRDNK